MKRNKVISILLLTITSALVASAQGIRSDLRSANDAYRSGDYARAETDFRRALSIGKSFSTSSFGLGNSLYQQKKYKEATSAYETALKDDKLTAQQRAQVYHNIGNVAMKGREYDKAIEAYKQSLINNPADDETRYNLVLAQKLQKKDQQDKNKEQDKNQQNNQQQQQKNQDNKQDKQNKDQQQPPKDQPKDGKQNQNSKGNPRDQQAEGKISKERVEQLLNSYKQSDEQTRRRVEQMEREAATSRKENNKRKW